MRGWTRAGVAIVAIALAATLAFAGTSTAHKRLYNAKLTISLNRVPAGDTASGQLKTAGRCLAGRVVSVFQDVNPSDVFDFQSVGKARTNKSGAWTLPIQGGIKKGDTYFARVSKRRLVNNATHKHTCKGAFSPRVVGV